MAEPSERDREMAWFACVDACNGGPLAGTDGLLQKVSEALAAARAEGRREEREITDAAHLAATCVIRNAGIDFYLAGSIAQAALEAAEKARRDG